MTWAIQKEKGVTLAEDGKEGEVKCEGQHKAIGGSEAVTGDTW